MERCGIKDKKRVELAISGWDRPNAVRSGSNSTLLQIRLGYLPFHPLANQSLRESDQNRLRVEAVFQLTQL
jgi:hypothetical protein